MGKSLPTCSVCGHSSHGKSRCTVFESEVSEEDIPDLGLCVFMDSHPCNCEGMPNAVAEDVVSRGAKASFEGQLAANLEAQSHEDERLAPFWKEVAAARDALVDHNKRAHAAATPYRQRKESLIKRLSHKAASLGLPVWPEQNESVDGANRG